MCLSWTLYWWHFTGWQRAGLTIWLTRIACRSTNRRRHTARHFGVVGCSSSRILGFPCQPCSWSRSWQVSTLSCKCSTSAQIVSSRLRHFPHRCIVRRSYWSCYFLMMIIKQSQHFIIFSVKKYFCLKYL